MPIRDTLAGWLRPPEQKASIIGLPSGTLPDRPLEKGATDDGLILSTYRDDPWPYICATKVAQQGSLPPLRFGTVDAEDQFTAVSPKHPLQQLFDNPNPQNTGGEFRQMLLIYMEMVGHAPIEVVRPRPGLKLRGNRAGFEMYVHNPTPWRIVGNSDGTVRGYLYIDSGGETDIKWDPTQMTYLRWPNPLNRWYGQGRISAVRQAVMAEEYAGIRDKKFEQTQGVPPGILTSDLPLGEPQAAELQRRWEKAVGGYRNAGKIAVLGSGLTYASVAMTRTDAEWIKSREWRVDEICGAFSIPKVLVVMGGATYANAKEARSEFWEGTLQPNLTRIEEMATNRLVPMLTDEPLVARFDYSHIDALNENQNEIAERAERWTKTGSVRRVEIRDLLGLQPFGDQRDDELATPAMLNERAQVVGQVGGETAESSQPATPTKMIRKAAREHALHPIRDRFDSDLRSFFRAQHGALQHRGLVKAPDDYLSRVLELLNAKRFTERLERILGGPIKASFALGAADAAARLDIGVSFSIDASAEALAAVNAHLVTLGNALQGTTTDDVTQVIRDALAEGVEYDVMRERLGALFDGYEDWRVDRIARTEVTRAYNTGSIGQYRSGGISQVYVTDGDGDEPCAIADGAIWSLEQAETDPLAHPNCTRSFDPIPPDEMPGTVQVFAAPAPRGTKLLYDESGRLAGWEDS